MHRIEHVQCVEVNVCFGTVAVALRCLADRLPAVPMMTTTAEPNKSKAVSVLANFLWNLTTGAAASSVHARLKVYKIRLSTLTNPKPNFSRLVSSVTHKRNDIRRRGICSLTCHPAMFLRKLSFTQVVISLNPESCRHLAYSESC